MKQQFEGETPYILHNHFDSPLRDFWKDPKNEELVTKMIFEQMENTFERGSIYEPNNIFDRMKSASFGPIGELKDEKLYLSGLYLIISKIYTIIQTKIESFNISEDVFFRILIGGMIHEYYSIGEFGVKIFNLIDKEIELSESKQRIEKPGPSIRRIFDDMIVYHLEDVSKDISPYEYINQTMKLVNKKSKNISLEQIKKGLYGSSKTGILSEPLLKISTEGINFSKLATNNDTEIIKGLRQIRIRRKTIFDPTKLISAIISIIYGDKEIFLSFDPYLFSMNLTELKDIKTNLANPTIIINLKAVIERVFCINCRKKAYKLESIFVGRKTNKEHIKEMFDDLFKTIDHIHPDDIVLTAKGKVNNNERFGEINENIPFGDVGFKKHNGEKKGIVFKVEKQLKNQKKKIE